MIADDVEKAARAGFGNDGDDPSAEGALRFVKDMLLAYHSFRTYSPEEVEAVARVTYAAQWPDDSVWEEGTKYWQEQARRAARAALAASDAWRARELEKLGCS